MRSKSFENLIEESIVQRGVSQFEAQLWSRQFSNYLTTNKTFPAKPRRMYVRKTTSGIGQLARVSVTVDLHFPDAGLVRARRITMLLKGDKYKGTWSPSGENRKATSRTD